MDTPVSSQLLGGHSILRDSGTQTLETTGGLLSQHPPGTDLSGRDHLRLKKALKWGFSGHPMKWSDLSAQFTCWGGPLTSQPPPERCLACLSLPTLERADMALT